ncbi:hypothetical protein AVEN_260913-1 [Araneus ventricosus]|uniref:Uncharacterized protein n=1 Tax=Araneus ventricosus TaxID=182803 RepID=A0A4Y2TK71_ARAVE|nr:hypothetical protein AVEN_260913-1 [Araneus ventricosus]
MREQTLRNGSFASGSPNERSRWQWATHLRATTPGSKIGRTANCLQKVRINSSAPTGSFAFVRKWLEEREKFLSFFFFVIVPITVEHRLGVFQATDPLMRRRIFEILISNFEYCEFIATKANSFQCINFNGIYIYLPRYRRKFLKFS